MSDIPARTPIIEAVIDIDCDMPPALDLEALEARARSAFADRYPKPRIEHVQEHTLEALGEEAPKLSVRRGIRALQFFEEGERQLVQVRTQGFAFNRLAPYTSLDAYLPEVERTWGLFVDLAGPLQVRLVRLRYINRLVLPLADGAVELTDYLATAPSLSALEHKLSFTGFLSQHAAVECGTDQLVKVTLTSQHPESDGLPVILDIQVAGALSIEPPGWISILAKIQALRALKNMVFRSTLTDRCLRLFQSEGP